jgi:hypothetical protein
MDFTLLTETTFLTETLIENSPVDGLVGIFPKDMTMFGLNTFSKWLMEKMGTNSTKMTFYFEKL